MPGGSSNIDSVHTDVHLTLDALMVKTKYINAWRRRHGMHTVRLGNLAVLMASVSGRDKMYRLLQATIKLVVWILNDVMEADFPKHVARLNRIASLFSAGRRFIRIGHTLGAIKGTIDGLQNDTDELGYRWATFISRLFGVTFLHLDHITWLASLGVIKLDLERQGVRASFCAFVNTFWQIVSDMITIVMLERKRKIALDDLKYKAQPAAETDALIDKLHQTSALHKNLIYNCIRNGLDLPGQLNGVFMWQSVPQSVWTLLAFISSCIGVWQSWPAKAPETL